MSKDNGTKGSAKPEKSGSHNSVAGRSETATDRVGEAPVLNYTDQAWLDSTKAPHISEEDELLRTLSEYLPKGMGLVIRAKINALLNHHTQSVLDNCLEHIKDEVTKIHPEEMTLGTVMGAAREAINTMKEGEKQGGLEKPKGGVQ